MKYIADFHIHSKYSRATSKDMNLEHMDKWAKIKGINILTTGDFTHPRWFEELKEELVEVMPGIYHLKKYKNDLKVTNFVLTTEVSCIYKKEDKVRRIHLLIFAPNLEVVEKINRKLGEKFNLKADGRPILGIDTEELTKILFDISKEIFIVPAHVWTPWYSLFGSKSGFDSIEQCFGEMTKYIFALETGLSSDPPMNWRLSALDRFTLISNSDAHSPSNLGREANVLELEELSYKNIIETIKTRKNFKYTIEFFPEEGKYHFDGHRLCGISLSPELAKKNKNICPKCGLPLTIGVLHRVDDLADRPLGFKPKNAVDFKSLIPLPEIIGQIYGVGKKTKKVESEYKRMIKKAGNEFNILLNLNKEDLLKITIPEIVQAIFNMREGKVIKKPGYDGVYGKIKIKVDEWEVKQNRLF